MSFFSNKRVLITGATGLIATHLVDELLKLDNVSIVAISRSREKLDALYAEQIRNGQVAIFVQDISEPLPKVGAVDFIFHAASPISGTVIKEKPVDVIKPNIIGTLNCLEFLRNQKEDNGINGQLVIFSSATVYANMGDEDVTVNESQTIIADPLDGLNSSYSESKRMVEVLARSYFKQYGVETLIARFGYLYGYSRFAPKTAFYEFINKALNGEDITLNNSDIARRDNIYVKDAVAGLLVLCENGVPGEAYNISCCKDNGNFVAADEIAKVIAEVVNENNGKAVQVKYLSGLADKRKPGIALDNSKLKTIGWTPAWSLEEGIRDTILQYK